MNTGEWSWFGFIQQKVGEAFQNRGNLNIIITGNTGVGKSTLINAVFEGNLAETGIGLPVSKGTREIKKEGIPLSIFDTRGLEKKQYAEIVQGLEKLIGDKRGSQNPNEHIHIAWVCILEDSRRVEPADTELVKMLNKYVPVIVVITKCSSDEGFRNKVQELLPLARVVVRVRAKKTILDDGHVIPAQGLEELIELTTQLVPEGVKNAVAAAQRVSLKIKQQRAQLFVVTGTPLAVTSGILPGINIAGSLAAQIYMIVGISAIWGLSLSKTFITTLLLGTLSGAIGASSILGTVLHLIPGIGSLSSAILAGAVTSTVGEAYIGSLTILTKRNPGRSPTEQEIKDEFRRQLPHYLRKLKKTENGFPDGENSAECL